MCVVSMVGDHYRDRWPGVFPGIFPLNPPQKVAPSHPLVWPIPAPIVVAPEVSREEYDELKREVLEMKEWLKRAKAYDERNNEPHCEVDEKMAFLRKCAELVGISLDDVLGQPQPE